MKSLFQRLDTSSIECENPTDRKVAKVKKTKHYFNCTCQAMRAKIHTRGEGWVGREVLNRIPWENFQKTFY